MNNQKNLFFWEIGKFVFNKRDFCENIVSKTSTYLSYYYGNSGMFSVQNIIFMRKFYLYFPIFNSNIYKLDWDSYVELMKIKNREICYFYYRISLFCNLNYFELKNLININMYSRLQ